MTSREISQKFTLNSVGLLIALTISGFEFISFFVQSAAGSRLITIPYRGFYIFLILFIVVKKKFVDNVKFPKVFVIIFVFWCFYFLKSIVDLFLNYDEVKFYAGEFYLFSFGLCFIPMLPMLLKIDETNLYNAKKYTIVLVLIANIWALKNNLLSVQDEQLGRFLGNEILNQITYGQTGVILIILSITSLLNTSILRKSIFLGLIVLGLFNVALAASRGPMIQLIICITLFFIINVKEIGAKNLIIIGIGVLGSLIAFADKLILFNTVVDRLNATGFNTGDGNAERYYLFKEGWQLFLDNPLLGDRVIGIYPHNLVLESLMALGILGGVFMLAILLVAVIEALNSIKKQDSNWLGLILLMQVISALVSGTIYNSFLLWPILVLVINLNYNRRYGYK